MNEDEINNALSDARLSGDVEMVAGNKFKLTPRGQVHAEDTIVEKGLPMIVAVMSQYELDQGRETTVVEMAENVIAKFPLALRQKAKANFEPFWGEFADWKPSEYLAAWHEAQDAAA